MSASTQLGQTTSAPIPGNGHARTKPGRKATAKAAPAQNLGQSGQGVQIQQPGVAGSAAGVNVAERRIGPIPAGVTTLPMAQGSLAWLYARQQECEIELRLIRQMITQFGPRRVTSAAPRRVTSAAPRKAKSKAKRKTAVARQAA